MFLWSKWFAIRPGELTTPPVPRHRAATPSERTLRREAVTRRYRDGYTPGRHVAPGPEVDMTEDAAWTGAVR